MSVLWILGATAAVVAIALARVPTRLVPNILGLGIAAIAIVWPAHATAGPYASRKAAMVLALLALYPLTLDVRADVPNTKSGPALAYRWPVGWPGPGWVLRHEVMLPDQGLPDRLFFVAVLADPYKGVGRLAATVNGRALGPMTLDADEIALEAAIPNDLLRPHARLAFDLRMDPYDAKLRLLAQPWAAGATLGSAASSFYDEHRWQLGTFNLVSHRPQRGVYVVSLRAEP